MTERLEGNTPTSLAVTALIAAVVLVVIVLLIVPVKTCYYDLGNPLVAPGQTAPPTPAVTPDENGRVCE